MSKDIVNDIVTIPGRNGGTLTAGNPGNKGGKGAVKSEVRDRCVGSFDQRIPIAEQILDDPNSTPADKLRALDILGKYGGLQQVDQTSGDKPLPTPVDFGGMSVDDRKEYLKTLQK